MDREHTNDCYCIDCVPGGGSEPKYKPDNNDIGLRVGGVTITEDMHKMYMFWHYDRYPYVVGSAVYIHESMVLSPAYGFVWDLTELGPKSKLVEYKDGVELAKKLNGLKEERKLKINEIETVMKNVLFDLALPFKLPILFDRIE